MTRFTIIDPERQCDCQPYQKPCDIKGDYCAGPMAWIKAGATICTDALMSYDDLEKDYDRQVIDHLECYAKGQVHTNGLENFGRVSSVRSKGRM